MNEELYELIRNVLTRYYEVEGQHCFDEKPKTDLQEAMQNLQIYYRRNKPHNPSLKADKLPSCRHVYKVALYNNLEVCVNCGHIKPLAP